MQTKHQTSNTVPLIVLTSVRVCAQARAKKGMTTGFTEVPVGSTSYNTRRRMVEDASGECEYM